MIDIDSVGHFTSSYHSNCLEFPAGGYPECPTLKVLNRSMCPTFIGFTVEFVSVFLFSFSSQTAFSLEEKESKLKQMEFCRSKALAAKVLLVGEVAE